MPFPPKSTKKNDDEEFERFAEMLRPVILRTRLTDILKMPPYAKYMKDIITNKRKISEARICPMLANYTLKMEYLKTWRSGNTNYTLLHQRELCENCFV